MMSTPARARRLFDRLAPFYDAINAQIYRREWLQAVRSEIRGTRVLDVGVGTGFTTGHLEGAVGIDLSEEMLRRARYRGDLIRGDVRSPPLRPGAFDTVVFAGSLYYLDHPATGLAAAAHLLRPGGRVIVLSPATRLLAPFVKILSQEEYRGLFEEAGLGLERYERLNWAACLVRGTKLSASGLAPDRTSLEVSGAR